MAGNYTINDADLDRFYMSTTTLINKYVKTGSLWMWGYNGLGGLGDNTGINRSSPVQTVASGTNWNQLSTANWSAGGIKTDGTLWTWGYNNYGQLGDNTVTAYQSPVQTVAGGTNWKQLAIGIQHSACIKTDGTLWTWGRGSAGQLGDNTNIGKSSPVQTISSGNFWKQVAVGYQITAAIKTDGTLWTWGRNDSSYNQLGDGFTISRSSPVQTVASGTNWSQVTCGAYSMAAVKTDGTLWAWGRNDQGQLGDNTLISRYSPVQTIAGGTNWKQASAGMFNTACIKTDGTLWMWGGNNSGSLGDNTRTARSSPVQTAAGGTNWRQVSALNIAGGGPNMTACIKTDGTLWTWGDNTYGNLGDNTTIAKSSPVQTAAGGTNWKQVNAGGYTNGAIHFYDAYNLYPK